MKEFKIKSHMVSRSRIWLKMVSITSPLLSDKIYLNLIYHHCYGKWINWENPQTFNEKLQWLKIYNRKPEYVIMADKIKAKDWVAQCIGEEYIIPTLGVWNNPDEINFEKLPEKFVLKCNHNSGMGMYICRDKSRMDIKNVKANLKKGLKENYFLSGREWPYKNISRKIIAEMYMEERGDNPQLRTKDTNHDLSDYKFYCFNGEPKYCQVIRNRSTKETIDFYDMNWVHQNFVGLTPFIENGKCPVEKPKKIEKMKEICRILSKSIPFVRIDLYVINGRIYFGEITFFPASGFGYFTPNKWAEIMGKLISLPPKTTL